HAPVGGPGGPPHDRPRGIADSVRSDAHPRWPHLGDGNDDWQRGNRRRTVTDSAHRLRPRPSSGGACLCPREGCGPTMARAGSLSRETIIQSMVEDLRELPYVHSFWEGGAAAFNRVDTWSDLDLYAVVDDGMVPATFEVVEKSLTALSPIQIRHEVAWPAASGISQRFYRLERATEFLLIDLAVLKASAPDKFLVPQIHGDAVFLFNKQNAISIPSFDAEAFIRGLLDRRKRLVERMALFGPFVEKEILRGNHLEALEFYRALVLPSLVEALRMRHGPRHYDFRMRYVHRELRPDLQCLDHPPRHRDPGHVLVRLPGVQGPDPDDRRLACGGRRGRGRRLHGERPRRAPQHRVLHHVPLRGPVGNPRVPGPPSASLVSFVPARCRFPPGPRPVRLEELLRPRERRDGAHDRLPRPGLGDRLWRVPARHGPRERAACGGLVIRREPP